MIGSLWNGLSGLNTFERALSVESNNSTNVSTVGYKADDVTFEDLLYKNGYGRGSGIQDIRKDMSQGTIKGTGNTYDVAIEGKGYFIVKQLNSNENFYTRTGNFRMGTDGLLESSSGHKVLGLTPQINNAVSSNVKVKEFNRDHTNFIYSQTIANENFIKTINSRTTDYEKSAKDVGVSGENFRNKGALLLDIESLIEDYKNKLNLYSSDSLKKASDSKSQITNLDFSNSIEQLENSEDYIKVKINSKAIVQKFDTSAEETLKKFADKISQEKGLVAKVDTKTNMLTINSLVPAKKFIIEDASISEKFSRVYNTQEAQLGSGIGLVNSVRDVLKNQLELANAEFIELTNTISYDKQEDLKLNPIQLKLENLELSENTFGKIEISEGFVFLNDNNNKYIVGKIQTANFVNEQGLTPMGNNVYQVSAYSGNPHFAGASNKLVTSSLEQSNSNVGNSLTKLLVYQKAFEANSKSITTSDEMLKTAMGIIK